MDSPQKPSSRSSFRRTHGPMPEAVEGVGVGDPRQPSADGRGVKRTADAEPHHLRVSQNRTQIGRVGRINGAATSRGVSAIRDRGTRHRHLVSAGASAAFFSGRSITPNKCPP